jgi:predicted nucleic acid-binding protein
MARILTDTNIWLRVVDPDAAQHSLAVNAVARLLAEGHEICLCPQNLIEFWAVATRPVDANGLGWTPEESASEIAGLESRFALLPDTPEIFNHWKTLVRTHAIRGKRTHDARLAAVYLAHRAQALLTLNPTDFASFPALRLLDPAQADAWNLLPELP